MKRCYFVAVCAALLLAALSPDANAGWMQNSRPSAGEQERSLIRKMYDRLDRMCHEMGNQETELKVFDEKLRNLEDTIEDLRRRLDNALVAQEDEIKGSKLTIENKMSTHDSTIKGVVTDLQKLQSHANTSVSAIEDYRSQVSELESIVRNQNRNIDNLKAAVKSLMEALGGTDGAIDSYRLYHVQSGDSLGLIAQKNNTTIRDIKDLNNLKNDVIIVGQKLKIPERK